jgi:branched-subunit amino acid transport protein
VLNPDILLLSLGLGLSIYLERAMPLWLLSGKTLPRIAIRWLHFVPAAVLAALLAPELLLLKNAAEVKTLNFTMENAFLWASAPAFIMAFKGSFFGTVAVGMAAVAAIRYFGG